MLHDNQEYADKMWKRVGRCFISSPDDPSRLVNKRQEEERAKAIQTSERNTAAVRTRYERRYERSQNVEQRAYESESVSDSGSKSESEKKEKEPTAEESKAQLPLIQDPPFQDQFEPLAKKQDRWFMEFWTVYWRKVDKQAALTSYKKTVLDAELAAEVYAAVVRQTPQMLLREPAHRPHAATWLNHKRWTDELESQALIVRPNGNGPPRLFPTKTEQATERFKERMRREFGESR